MTTNLKAIYEKYMGDENFRNLELRPSESREIRQSLKTVDAREIDSIESAKCYLELVNTFRRATEASIESSAGRNFSKTVKNLLAAGGAGVYSSNLRLIYELIQNVDDCDFPSEKDRHLTIEFIVPKGEIVLRYNETGFTPMNVFAITGIAEEAKNIDPKKVEIGEKGIGFKSVFGIAQKVYIQSGFFSFELHVDDVTIPIAKYRNYKPVEGTVMIISTTSDEVEKIYNLLCEKYDNQDSLFTENPILFLNKLTSLKFFSGNDDSIEFKVKKSQTELKGDYQFIANENLSLIRIKNGIEKKQVIHCSRYSILAEYDLDAYRSRYGNDHINAYVSPKQMMLHVVVPKVEYLEKITSGVLYSFLPTQIKMNVPFAVHVPFKLDASREHVDPDDCNNTGCQSLWFTISCARLATLLEHTYMDLANNVDQKIIYYLPEANSSIFKLTSGKESCLCEDSLFLSERYLELELFLCDDGIYYKASDIICIKENEPENCRRVHALLDSDKSLFIPPASLKVEKYGIEIIKDVVDKVLTIAMEQKEKTSDGLKYLMCYSKIQLEKENIEKLGDIKLDLAQIYQISKYPELLELFNNVAIDRMKHDYHLLQTVLCKQSYDINQLLSGILDVKDLPNNITKYLKGIDWKYATVSGIEDAEYFITKNKIVFTKGYELEAFADFCGRLDKRNLASAFLKLNNESKKLDRLESQESTPPAIYLETLYNVRRTVKNVLGKAYQRYIELLLEAGTDKERFLFELLQNADDCEFNEDIVPTFLIKEDAGKLISQCNEVGFKKEEIRAITAIGESTKKKLLLDDRELIGEKGVGFKTVFAIASKVKIDSGNFHFALTEKEPTIPEIYNSLEKADGTIMEFDLKDRNLFASFTDKKVLEMCLCLHHLKNITIGEYVVSIVDTKNERIIKINENEYVFRRGHFTYNLDDKKFKEGKKRVYIYSLKSASKQLELTPRVYNGLPTDIRTKIPAFIDAPLDLNTSRDNMLDNEKNSIIKRMITRSLVHFIENNSKDLRGNVLDYMNFVERESCGEKIYVVNMFSNPLLSDKGYLKELKESTFLPTMDKDTFVKPGDAKRYPHVIQLLFDGKKEVGVDAATVLDIGSSDKYSTTLNALGCKKGDLSTVLSLLEKNITERLKTDQFRISFFSFLKNNKFSVNEKERLKKLEFIPVYPVDGSNTEYISWNNNKIFTKEYANNSTSSYYVLNENIINKQDLENILSVNINEMNEEYEHANYYTKLQYKLENLNKYNAINVYNDILKEYLSGNIEKHSVTKLLIGFYTIGNLPLKNLRGNVVRHDLFINDGLENYFSEIINQICIHEEASGLACILNLKPLSEIHYDDIPESYKMNLTADDVETFLDNFFIYGIEILGGFYGEGFIDDDIIEKCNLHFLEDNYDDIRDDYDFPNNPVVNRELLVKHINKDFKNLHEITVEKRMREVRVVNYNGKNVELNSSGIRQNTLKRYCVEESKGVCVCQMCKQTKLDKFMEVNNIELKPRYYWEQTRVALCLECSKIFKGIRENDSVRNRFMEDLMKANAITDMPVEIPIGDRTITFTQTHLAEVQEILKKMNKK